MRFAKTAINLILIMDLMNYQTFLPHQDLAALIKCYWTLEVPALISVQRQRIIPDGCIEMAFILGNDIKRYTCDQNFILQPRAMVLGQTIEPFYIEPTGYVNTFAIRFYPYGFANFISIPASSLVNKETALEQLFGEKQAGDLEQDIIDASDTMRRIEIIEIFLKARLNEKQTIDNIVKSTIDTLLLAKGSISINTILKDEPSLRRTLERKFQKQIGISPKQLSKVIRLQAALKMLLNQKTEKLTEIAYENEYYDQAHFIKDFKQFTGTNPGEFLSNDEMSLSSIFYS
jgi:AraC-like DNA-binding protein